jgi:hypothetical protein
MRRLLGCCRMLWVEVADRRVARLLMFFALCAVALVIGVVADCLGNDHDPENDDEFEPTPF